MPYQGISKPFAFYTPKPDICNFPNENVGMSKDFNFLCEFLKFAPKLLTVALEGDRIGKQNDEGEYESSYTFDGWPLSDEWVEALNEYEVTDDLAWLWTDTDKKYNAHCESPGWEDFAPRNNLEALQYRDDKGYNVWSWSRSWVHGMYHFNTGLFPQKGEYFWGEAVASTVINADFIAEGHEWNHLEIKQPLGLKALFSDNAPQAKDETLNAGVADQAYFINDFLSGINSSWTHLNDNVLKGGGRQNYSYYQLVMNSTQPGRASYKGLSTKNKVLLIAAMVESRNRAYSAMEKIFGPVYKTWDDQAMMANFSSWLSNNSGSAVSQGVNAMRMFLHLQHFFQQVITNFAWPKVDNDLAAGMLDVYAFSQFSKDMGAEKYFDRDIDGKNGKSTGAIFQQIKDDVFGGSIPDHIMTFLRQNLKSSFSIHTQPSDINLADYLSDDNLDDLSPSQKTKLQAYKWLLEQWFGSQKIDQNYNAMPKYYKQTSDIPEFYNYSLDGSKEGEHWDYFYLPDDPNTRIRVPYSISKSNSQSARSYNWDRISAPWSRNGYDGAAFRYQVKSGGSWGDLLTAQSYGSSSSKWPGFYNALRDAYGELAYLSPYTGDNHKNLMRVQFAGLDQRDIIGKGNNNEPYQNGWTVWSEGNLIIAGEKRNKARMIVYQFMASAERSKQRRRMEEFRNKKEDAKDAEREEYRFQDKIKEARNKGEARFKKSSQKNAAQTLKLEKKAQKKMQQKAAARRKAEIRKNNQPKPKKQTQKS